MEENASRNSYRSLLILSVVVNVLLASFAGYTLWQGEKLRSQINVLSQSYNELAESRRNLEQQLNMTMTQLNYYKEQAEYYSSLKASGNATAGVMGRTAFPIVALRTIRRGFSVEYQGVVMSAEVELREGDGRILVNTVPKIGIDIQTSMRTGVRVAEDATGVSLSKTDVILTITASQDVEIVDGPSAGAAMTVALIATIREQSLNQSVYMTGTINGDGSIGPVGGVPEKALAAAEAGSTHFLVPKGQSTIVVYVPKTIHPAPGWTITTYERRQVKLQDYLEERGYSIAVEEVANIEEAYAKVMEIQAGT